MPATFEKYTLHAGVKWRLIRVTKKEALATSLTNMIDELGDLEQETRPFRAKLKRLEVLKAGVRAAFEKDPERSVVAEGNRWRVLLGPAGNQSTVDVELVWQLVGPTMFRKIATISISSLESNVGPDILGSVVTTTPTGTRPMNIVAAEDARLRAAG